MLVSLEGLFGLNTGVKLSFPMLSVARLIENGINKKFKFKNSWGCCPPHSNYLGGFLRLRRTFAEVITFVGASAHKF